MTPSAGAVLWALSALSPVGAEPRSTGWTVPLDWFRWLPVSAVRLLAPGPLALFDTPVMLLLDKLGLVPKGLGPRGVLIDDGFGERLAAVDLIRPGAPSLRVGWLFVAGRTRAADGRPVQVLHPLVSLSVRVVRQRNSSQLFPAGDPELTPLIVDRALRHELESGLELGGGSWTRSRTSPFRPNCWRACIRFFVSH